MTAPTRAHSTSGWPMLTAAVVAITVAISVAALVSPGLMDLLTRNLTQVRQGEWWRVATPVLVQSSGWGQLVFNMLGLAVVGAALESRLSRSMWAVTYLVGGIGSIALGSVWHPHAGGGGSSDAVGALIGALAVLSVASRQTKVGDFPAQLYSAFFATYLTGLALGGVVPAIIAGNGAIILWSVARRAVGPVTRSRACLALVFIAGGAMTVAKDSHGTGIVAGLAIGSLVLAGRRRTTGALVPPATVRAPVG